MVPAVLFSSFTVLTLLFAPPPSSRMPVAARTVSVLARKPPNWVIAPLSEISVRSVTEVP